MIWRLIIAGGCLVVLATAPLPHTDADALMYGKIAKNMLASGDWVTLRYEPTPPDVPPLTIWLMAVSLRLAGDSAAALRLWHLLMALALAGVTYRIARLAAGEETALLAALVLLTTNQVLAWSLAPKQDIPVTLFLSLAFYCYLLYREHGRTRTAAAAGLWVALAVLAKGPVALAVFGLIAGADLLVARRLAVRAHWRWSQAAAAGAVFVVVAAPWFVYGTVRWGMSFVRLFVLQQANVLHNVQGYAAPLPYWIGLVAYVPLLIAAVFPWTVLLPGALREGLRSLRRGDAAPRLCFIWAAVVFGLVSIVPGTKSMRYLMPVYPPLAVLSAYFLNRVLDTPGGLRAPATALAAFWGAVLVAAIGFGAGRSVLELRGYIPLIAVFTAAVFGFWLAVRRGRARPAIAILAAGTLGAYGLFAWTSTTEFAARRQLEAVAARIDGAYRPGDRVVNVGSEPLASEIVNYYLRGPTMVSTDEATLRRDWTRGGLLAYVAPDVYRDVAGDLHPVTLMRTREGWFLVTNRPPGE